MKVYNLYYSYLFKNETIYLIRKMHNKGVELRLVCTKYLSGYDIICFLYNFFGSTTKYLHH